jgi:hypothetical protein
MVSSRLSGVGYGFMMLRINLHGRTAVSLGSTMSMSFLLLVMGACTIHRSAQKPTSIPEEIEWTCPSSASRSPLDKCFNLGRLRLAQLLCASYPRPCWRWERLSYGPSTSVDDPRLPRQITEFGPCRMYVSAWSTSIMACMAGPTPKRSIRRLSLNSCRRSVPWETKMKRRSRPTPLHSFSTQIPELPIPRIENRNAIALALVKAAGIPLDDQHALMSQHADLSEDSAHFNSAGPQIQGDQAAFSTRTALLPVSP